MGRVGGVCVCVCASRARPQVLLAIKRNRHSQCFISPTRARGGGRYNILSHCLERAARQIKRTQLFPVLVFDHLLLTTTKTSAARHARAPSLLLVMALMGPKILLCHYNGLLSAD